MKTFEELCAIYDRCKDEAKLKLPSIHDVNIPEFIVPVQVPAEVLIQQGECGPFPKFDNVIHFRFRKQIVNGIFVGWESA